jgi:hypothetical protein
MFKEGLDFGLAIGLNSVSQGGGQSSDFASSYYFSPTAHYGFQSDKTGWGGALYWQGTAGFRQGAGVPSNSPDLLGTQATLVAGYEKDKKPVFVDMNLTGGLNSVGSFSAGPNLSLPSYFGTQVSTQINIAEQKWTVLGELFVYGEHGSSFTDQSGAAGPSLWGVRYGGGVGFARNYLVDDPIFHRDSQTSTVGVNFDVSHETLWVGPSGSSKGGQLDTNTLWINLTFGYRKP